jgi:hypothetical protein
MSILEFNSQKETTHVFNINMSGSEQEPQIQLEIPINETSKLTITSTKLEENKYSIIVPALGNFINEFNNPIDGVKLSAIVEGETFYPWEGQYKVKQPVSIVAENLDEDQKPAAKTKVKNKPTFEVNNIVSSETKENNKILGNYI